MSRTPAPKSYMGIPMHQLPKLAEYKTGAPKAHRMLSELSGSSNSLIAPLTTAFRVMDLTAAPAASSSRTVFTRDNPSYNASTGLTHMRTRSAADKDGISLSGFGSVTFHHLLYANGTNRPHRGMVMRGALGVDGLARLRTIETKVLSDLKRKQEDSSDGGGEDGGLVESLTNTSWRPLVSLSRNDEDSSAPRHSASNPSSVTTSFNQGMLFPPSSPSVRSGGGETTNRNVRSRGSEALEEVIPRFVFEVGQRESIEWLGGVLNPHRLERSRASDAGLLSNAPSSASVYGMSLLGKDRTLEAGYFPAAAGLAPPANLLANPASVRANADCAKDEADATVSTDKAGPAALKGERGTRLFDSPADVPYGVSEPWRMGTSLEPRRRVVVQDEFVSYSVGGDAEPYLLNGGAKYTLALERALRVPAKNRAAASRAWNEIKHPYFQHKLKETILVPTTRLLLRVHVPKAIADMCVRQNDQAAIHQVKQGHRSASSTLVPGGAPATDGAFSSSLSPTTPTLPTTHSEKLIDDIDSIYEEGDGRVAQPLPPSATRFQTMHRQMALSVDNFGTDRPLHDVRVGPGDVIYIPRGWKYELLRELGRSTTDVMAMARRRSIAAGREDAPTEATRGRVEDRGAVELLVADSAIRDNAPSAVGTRKHSHTALLVNLNALGRKATPSRHQGQPEGAGAYIPQYKRKQVAWGRAEEVVSTAVSKVAQPTDIAEGPSSIVSQAEGDSTGNAHQLIDEPVRLVSCDCFKISFLPFPVLTEKQREIYLASDFATSVMDFYERGGNNHLKHFVH